MVTLPQCTVCRHVDEKAKTRPDGIRYLGRTAFPDGIPDEIIYNKVSHQEAYPGDYGIQFEPMEESGASGSGRDAAAMTPGGR